MGYEVEVPPVPDREGEKKIIANVKRSFKTQRWWQYYMAESTRLSKMDYKKRKDPYLMTWLLNFTKGAVISGFFLMALPPFYKKMSSGAPFSPRPKMILASTKAYNFNMRSAYLASLRQIGIGFVFSFLYASCYTFNPLNEDRRKIQPLSPR